MRSRTRAERAATWLPLLACLLCPVCLTAIAGVLSSLGLAWLLREEVHASIMSGALIASTVSVAWSAGRRGRRRPVVVVVVGAIVVLGGHAVDSTIAELIGVALLLAGSLWNARLATRGGPVVP